MSLIALTDEPTPFQSGSARTPGSDPSPIFQNIQKRLNSL